MKILSKRTQTAILSALFVFSLVFVLFSVRHNSHLPVNKQIQKEPASIAKEEVVPLKQEPVSFGLPMHLKIPVINVDSTVLSLGLTPDGAMDVPKGPDDVAWYKLGKRPGENGNAVIAGHHGTWKNGKGSVFDNLNKLVKGDKLYVEDDKGMIASFVVRESRKYDPNADAQEVFDSSDGKVHLNLITCNGVWNKATKSYPERLVVFTDKE